VFEQTFKNIDDVLWKEAGCTTELDYVEQTSWLLFLKYLDDLEIERALEAELANRAYTPIIDAPHRWSRWAAPKDGNGKIDLNRALTGPDLIDYVNRELFPYLQGFRGRSEPNTVEYKIGEIFGELKNKFTSGYSLRDALDLVDQLRFGSQAEKHELSELYEAKIRKMGNAGRNGGEYYTPRPLIRAMIKVVKPTLNDRIYDGACGSAGFLCEAFDYLKQHAKSTRDMDWLQTKAFTGKEKKSLAYVIGTMNMILHGIDAPNIVHANTLSENVLDIQEKARFDVVLANPPFGGKERPEIQQNFPIEVRAYLRQPVLRPPFALPTEYRLDFCVDERLRLGEVFFGVGGCGGDGSESLVQYRHNPPLFIEGRERDLDVTHQRHVEATPLVAFIAGNPAYLVVPAVQIPEQILRH
jgi:type I restriction enzyme M protein